MRKIALTLFCICVFWTSCDLLDQVVVDVSGKVTDESVNIEGAIVLLVKSAEISDGLELSNGSFTDNHGNYTILKVDPGDYYVVAIDDANDNLEFDSDTDQLGFYGDRTLTDVTIPKKITVDEDDLKDINITDLYSISGK